MSIRLIPLILAALLASSGARVASAQGAPTPAEAALSPQEAEAALAEIERLVRERYVEESRRAAVLAALAEGRRAGRYATRSPQDFAKAVTADLERASRDKHMYLSWAPEQYKRLTSEAAGGDGPSPAYFSEHARRGNHGLQESRILPGNVRYLKIRSFMMWDPEKSPAGYDAAMRFLKEGDAAIIDLRGNGGGFAEPGEYLLSHFVPAGVLLHTSLYGKEKQPAFARADLPAGRMIGKPLYVLIDRGVASASEAVALSVDRFKLGELIGATTAGAGNRNQNFAVAPNFVASISVGTVRHGLDGSGWEATGVAPHVEAPPETALEVAYARALERLAVTGPEPLRAEYRWNLEAARAALDPPKLTPSQLAAYPGRYGDIVVTLREGRLYRQRAGAPDLALRPVSADTFAVGSADDTRLRFEREGGVVTAATYVTKAGPMQRLARSPAGAAARMDAPAA